MELLRPKRIIRKKGAFQASFELSMDQSYTFEENGVNIRKAIRTFYASEPSGQFKAVIPKAEPITREIIEAYHNFQNLINHCNNNAEVINNLLRDLLISLKEVKATKEDIMAMDFMKLRGVFSTFLNSYTPIKRELNFNTKEKRKNITSTLFDFISDRNIYTHGVLQLRRPDDVFVIVFIENKKVKLSAEISVQVMTSFLEVSNWMIDILKEIQSFYRRSTGDNASLVQV